MRRADGRWHAARIVAVAAGGGSCDVCFASGAAQGGVAAALVRRPPSRKAPPAPFAATINTTTITTSSSSTSNSTSTNTIGTAHTTAPACLAAASKDPGARVALGTGAAAATAAAATTAAAASETLASESDVLPAGSLVEANFEGAGEWYPGTVTAVAAASAVVEASGDGGVTYGPPCSVYVGPPPKHRDPPPSPSFRRLA